MVMKVEEKANGGRKDRCAMRSLKLMQVLGWRGRLNWVLHDIVTKIEGQGDTRW